MMKTRGVGTCFFQVPTPVSTIKRLSRLNLISHTVTFPLDNHSFRMMQNSVKDSRGEGAVVIEDFRPVFKGPVWGNNQSALLIAEAKDLKQKVCSFLVNRQERKRVRSWILKTSLNHEGIEPRRRKEHPSWIRFAVLRNSTGQSKERNYVRRVKRRT